MPYRAKNVYFWFSFDICLSIKTLYTKRLVIHSLMRTYHCLYIDNIYVLKISGLEL